MLIVNPVVAEIVHRELLTPIAMAVGFQNANVGVHEFIVFSCTVFFRPLIEIQSNSRCRQPLLHCQFN